MEEIKREDIDLVRCLNRHPNLKARVGALLTVAEAAMESGEMTADEVEIQLREKVRELGQNTLQDWAISKEQRIASELKTKDDFKRHGKKNSIGIRHLA